MKLLIKLKEILVEYNGQDVLNIEELDFYDYDKIGLVGDNGSGKSTLMKIMLEEIKPDSGTVQKDASIAYIPQLEAYEYKGSDYLDQHAYLDLKNKDLRTISNGEEVQLKIADALGQYQHAIFADEPTSFLDTSNKEELINSFKYYPGALLIVSHDRYFLDQVVDKIWELKDGKINEYYGNYSEYLRQKEEELLRIEENFQEYLNEKDRLEKALVEKKANALKSSNKSKKNKSRTNEGGRLGHQKSHGSKEKRLHKEAKNLEKRLHDLDFEKPDTLNQNFKFRTNDELELFNDYPIVGRGVSKSYHDREIFIDANFDVQLNSKVALVGDNGSGKTTLFRMIEEMDVGISIAPKVKIGYFKQDSYKTKSNESIIEYLSNHSDYSYTDIRSVLAALGFDSGDINKRLSVLSGGEMMKLQLTRILIGRYNVLMLDEPTNFLDVKALEGLESLINQSNKTVFFVSHDRQFIDNVADKVYCIKDKKIVEDGT